MAKEDVVRPIPWMLRLGLFAVGFGIGFSRYASDPPQRAIVIEVRNPLQDSTEAAEPQATVAAMPQRDKECRPDSLDNHSVRTADFTAPRARVVSQKSSRPTAATLSKF